MNITEIKAGATISSKDELVVCNSGTALALTLKSAVGDNTMFYIKNIGLGAVTITCTSPDLLDNASTKVLAQYESCVILDYKTNVWIVI